MLSKDEVARYREMGHERRYSLFLELAGWAWRALDSGGPRTAARRWKLILRQHDEANRLIAERFSRLK